MNLKNKEKFSSYFNLDISLFLKRKCEFKIVILIIFIPSIFSVCWSMLFSIHVRVLGEF